MLRKMIESITGTMSDYEFKEVMDAVTKDIKANRIAFGKRTNLEEIKKIASQSTQLLRRCN